MSEQQAYPLSWPQGWPRTRSPERSRFDVTLAVARDGLLHELYLLGARDIVISSNVVLRQDGFLNANRGEPDDPAVAVYFTLNGEQRSMPVDKWDRVKDNMRAIQKSIEAMRGLSRWGAESMVNAAFAGFAALPAGGGDSQNAWWTVLDVEPSVSLDDLNRRYRELVRQHHPDRGGNEDMFMLVQNAYQQAKGVAR